MDLATTYEAIKVSSGNSFVHETESQVILNGSRDIELFQDGKDRYGPRELSPNIIRRLEDATGHSILADGFPAVTL